MNSVNILSAIGPSHPRTTRSSSSRRSAGNVTGSEATPGQTAQDESSGARNPDSDQSTTEEATPVSEKSDPHTTVNEQGVSVDEKTPLLAQSEVDVFDDAATKKTGIWLIPKSIASALIGAFRIMLSTVVLPGQYVIACFYDEEGRFSALLPLRRAGRSLGRKRRKAAYDNTKAMATEERLGGKASKRKKGGRAGQVGHGNEKPSPTTDSPSDSEPEDTPRHQENDSPSRNTRSKSLTSDSADEARSDKKSIRIRIYSEDANRQRKQRKSNTTGTAFRQFSPDYPSEAAAAALKSPPSPGSPYGAAKYPRMPAPPRPLIPRRQPSYVITSPTPKLPRKTLIIDLDETLIHSMAKGGRMSTGHMVEVKLQHPVGVGGTTLGPQIPILYYVHKRPHCDEFLRKVCKWYNLVIFTASVQEYADPVIDWLELERQYFSGRYYRQHCTYRNGAYIKDVSQVEPDLSKVMILDNSPMSYIFHEDNALPIEGWISDPTDNDLLNLIPLLEGLQYVTDVRALLALRLGESTAA